MPRRCWMWPDVPFCSTPDGSMWLDAALDLGSLATRLATRNLVSNANVRTIETSDSSIKCVWRSTDRSLDRHPREEVSLPALLAPEGGGDRPVSAKHPQP